MSLGKHPPQKARANQWTIQNKMTKQNSMHEKEEFKLVTFPIFPIKEIKRLQLL